MIAKFYNVYATNIETGEKRIIAENKTEKNAEAIIKLCVMCQGVDDEFFNKEEIGKGE